jgi:hypothetical protein
MTIEQAATGQLETAIELWFHDKDPVSIHTLAVAAEGMLTTIARNRGVKLHSNAMNYLASTPKNFQKFMRNPQNFFKHGNPKLEWDAYHPEQGETFLASAVGSYMQLFTEPRPLIVMFALWIGGEQPTGGTSSDSIKSVLIKCAQVRQLPGMTKKRFFDLFFARITEISAAEEE